MKTAATEVASGGAGARRLRTVISVAAVVLGFVVVGLAQTDSDAGSSNKSWTGSSETQNSDLGTDIRQTESHSQNGNRTLDKQSVEVKRSGSFEPYQDVEKESVKVNDSTTRTVVRTFGRDANGERVLVQVTEEEKQTLPDGSSKVVRSTLNPDANANTQLVQREVTSTRKISANVEETTTTVSLPGANGGLAPSMKVQERQEHTDEHTIQFHKSTMLPDGAGNWEVGEVRKGTITEDGKNRTTDEHVSRPGSDGQLVEVQHTIGKEVQSAAGDKRSTVENYSATVPGESADGSLHLVERVTTTDRSGSNGRETTQRQVEQVNPGDPNAGLEVTVVSTDSKSQGASGTRETRTLQVRNADGSLDAVSVDMGKSDKTPPVQVQIAPADKAK
jgi:hypothetical protein